MMWFLRLNLAVVFALVGAVAYADEPLTVEQLHEAAQWATSDFSDSNPDQEVYGFTVARGAEEGAIVRVYYNGGESFVGYFCHVHDHDHDGGDIDCHELN